MNLLNLSGGTWQVICTALIAVAITSCVIGVWRDSRRIRRVHVRNERKPYTGMWPDCADPPCDFEDNYACVLHRPRCRGSLDDQPAALRRAAVMATDRRKP